MPSASSTSKIRLSWLRKSSGVSRRLALYSTHCSCLKVGSPRSNATATCVGFSSRSTLMSIAVNPYTALVGWPVVVAKFSTGRAKNARYASEWPSSRRSLSVTLSILCPAAGWPPVIGHRIGLLVNREREDRRRGERLARVQGGGREIRLVGRVREVLGLERVARA